MSGVRARVAANVVVLVCAAALLTSCGQTYSIDCGPLGNAACADRVTQIVSVVKQNFPDRKVASIVVENALGDARVLLDDGTQIGFGRRLAALITAS